jgi:hypothetical protein
MKGPLIGYGCFLTMPLTTSATPSPSRGWQWQPYADFTTWWNHQPATFAHFPLLFGGIHTPEYLALIIAAGETDTHDRQAYPWLQMLGNFVFPLDNFTTGLSGRLSPPTLRQAEAGWNKVVVQAKVRGLVLEERATLLFIYEQDLCEDP